MVNQFTWWPNISEEFPDSIETPKEPLVNQNWEEIEADGAWIFWKFEAPETPEQEKSKKERQEQLNNKSENLKNCILDISKIESIPELESFDFTTVESEFESEVLNKIWGNYLKTPNESGEFDIEVDFSTAILETRNEILKECANVNIDSETYKVAIRDIKSGDIEKQLEWIESLYILAYSNEWTLWKTTLDKYKKSKQKKLEDEAKKIEKQLNSEGVKNNKDILDKLNKRKQEIINEMSEMTWFKDWKQVEDWDIFKASKIESNSERAE
jgi:hypothetical protein